MSTPASADGPAGMLLVLGGSFLQAPLINTARDLGVPVAVVDMNPDAVGAELADEFFAISTTDTAAVLDLAKRLPLIGVTTAATDMPMRTVAAVCDALDLPGPTPDVAFVATDKVAMIEALSAAGVAVPKFIHLDTDAYGLLPVDAGFSFPVIVKPADSSGSRGVTLAENAAQLSAAIDEARRFSASGKTLVEEFLHGDEVSVEVLCSDEGPVLIAVTDKNTTGAPEFVEIGHSQPSGLPADQLEAVRELAAQACTALGLTQCAAHVEIMATPDGPRVIEVGARLGGDLITSHLTPLSTGVDMLAGAIALATGQAPDTTPKHERASAVRFLTALDGTNVTAAALDRARAVPNIVEVHWAPTGVAQITSSAERSGHIVAAADTLSSALEAIENARAQLNGSQIES